MKIRRSEFGDSGKIEIQMAPMIDVVFQLLIFFMLTLKILTPEGNFDINMPIGGTPGDTAQTLDIKVKLAANEDGSLAQIFLGSKQLGNDVPLCFERLNGEIAALAGAGGTFQEDVQVEIDADYGLEYQYSLKAISACTGRVDPVTKQRVRYVSNIKFTPPRRPGGPEA